MVLLSVESASVDAGVSMEMTLRLSVTRAVLFLYIRYALMFKLCPQSTRSQALSSRLGSSSNSVEK